MSRISSSTMLMLRSSRMVALSRLVSLHQRSSKQKHDESSYHFCKVIVVVGVGLCLKSISTLALLQEALGLRLLALSRLVSLHQAV